jgi:SAM-dependent methyltransferase
VLDVGGGTGHHAALLAGWGLSVTIADPSRSTLDAACAHLPEAVRVEQRGFGELGGLSGYDLVMCLGNTLPHVPDLQAFREALRELISCARPGGIVLCHQLSYEYIVGDFARRRFLPARGNEDRFLLRFFEREADGLRFTILRVSGRGGDYTTEFLPTRHTPVTASHYRLALADAGVRGVEFLGSYGGQPFVEGESEDLLVIVRV